jgi:hypothetical protein
MSYKFNPFTGKLDDVSANTVTPGVIDNAIVRADGTGNNAIQGSDINIDDATTSTQANVAIVNQHSGQTNSALVLTPKGSGALIAGPKPDGTTVGGNARGLNSVDLQRNRNLATQVASGSSSVISGGSDNSISSGFASGAVISGGNSNTVSASTSVISGGSNNTASGLSSVISGGNNNTASTQIATISGGRSGLADRWGMRAYSTGSFATQGDAQHGIFVLRCITTTNTAVDMGLNFAPLNVLQIPSGKVMAMNINISGVSSDGSAVAHYLRQYAVKNVAGTSSQVYAPVTIGTDNAAGTSIAISVNDTDDSVRIAVTGVVSQTWRWVATVDAVEIGYGT